MREQPNGKALLAIARQVLKDAVLPQLPKDQLYNGLMIANAMAIAARQFDDEAIEQEWDFVKLLFSEDEVNSLVQSSHSMAGKVLTANQLLAKKIRAGELDSDDHHSQLSDALSFQVLQRLKESNPKALP